MRNILAVIGLLAASLFATEDNYNGMLDTSNITVTYGVISYSKGFPLSQLEDIRVVLKSNDITSAGFKSDSLAIQWGWITYNLCLDSGKLVSRYDTCFDQGVIADTLDLTAMLKTNTFGNSDSTGAVARNHRFADTLHCRGYAVQSKWILPEWDQNIKFWAKGIGDHKDVTPVPAVFEVKRRLYVNVRNR